VELQLPVDAAVDIAVEAGLAFLSSHADHKELQLVFCAWAGSPAFEALAKHSAFTQSHTNSTSAVESTVDSTPPAAAQSRSQQLLTCTLDKRLKVVEGSIVQLRDAGCPCAYIVNPIGLRAIKPFGKTGDAVHAACGEDLCKCTLTCFLIFNWRSSYCAHEQQHHVHTLSNRHESAVAWRLALIPHLPNLILLLAHVSACTVCSGCY
jgi:hypothetical protein